MTDKSEPLTPEEEKRLREMSLRGYEPGAQQWIEGLLATLDAERAMRLEFAGMVNREHEKHAAAEKALDAARAAYACDPDCACACHDTFDPSDRAERAPRAGTTDELRAALKVRWDSLRPDEEPPMLDTDVATFYLRIGDVRAALASTTAR